jgi:hypothetical protein
MNLTPQKKLELIRRFKDDPSATILYIFDMLSKEMNEYLEIKKNELSNEIAKIKNGKDSDPMEVARILTKNSDFIKKLKGKDGDNYILTNADKEKIARSIEVPIVKQIIEKREVIKEQPIITEVIKEKAITDKPIVIAEKLNTLIEKVEPSVIKGLLKRFQMLEKSVRDRKGGGSTGGGGMGNVQHENYATTSATTSITTSYKIAGNGTALWVFYNGQQLFKGTHYTVGSDQKTITFLIALEDSTNISVTYIRS